MHVQCTRHYTGAMTGHVLAAEDRRVPVSLDTRYPRVFFILFRIRIFCEIDYVVCSCNPDNNEPGGIRYYGTVSEYRILLFEYPDS